MGLRIYTGGTFDLFHAGHVKFLKRCQELAGLSGTVTVSLNTDEFIYEYKKVKPILSYEERFEVLSSCKFVNFVVPNSGGVDSKPAIEECKPDVIAIGSDWARKDYYKQMQFDQDWLDERNISLIYIPYTKGISSTLIKQKI
ncbi:TagD Cytidylyltransferase [uncultured Caudovirales phage]|jgi:glycerol-3-phosphate cytidylyltransferase|uniref:TagD Cytidylyltransferase n=1 Tax=uncultured Caudovirales phage TaxID=2100421 RepID=A0A6J5NEH1_9CAUD|nr:TagD Cytidylyltransferase [uncultured Caudovirales phage]